jgi:hypothetical protein
MKVKLPKVVFDLIESERFGASIRGEKFERTFWKRTILKKYLNCQISGASLDIILDALVNDYELEKTPEEEVREYYNKNLSILRDTNSSDYDRQCANSKCTAINTTLNKLGRKIEGINT